MPWRTEEGGQPTLEALIRGLFEPARLLDYLRSCVVFEEDERGNIAKKIAGYHQFRAVARLGPACSKHSSPPPARIRQVKRAKGELSGTRKGRARASQC